MASSSVVLKAPSLPGVIVLTDVMRLTFPAQTGHESSGADVAGSLGGDDATPGENPFDRRGGGGRVVGARPGTRRRHVLHPAYLRQGMREVPWAQGEEVQVGPQRGGGLQVPRELPLERGSDAHARETRRPGPVLPHAEARAQSERGRRDAQGVLLLQQALLGG